MRGREHNSGRGESAGRGFERTRRRKKVEKNANLRVRLTPTAMGKVKRAAPLRHDPLATQMDDSAAGLLSEPGKRQTKKKRQQVEEVSSPVSPTSQ